MASQSVIEEIERRAAAVDKPVYLLFEEAGLAASTFYRWKDGADPKLSSLDAVMNRLTELEQAA